MDVEPKPCASSNQRLGRALRTRPSRRSLSGAPLTDVLENNKFQHFRTFQRSQRDARGINFLLAPVAGGPLYRSSLPVTPIATPILSQAIKFTEQSLHNRLLMQLPQRGLIQQPNVIKEDAESQTDVPVCDRLNPVPHSESTDTMSPENKQDEKIDTSQSSNEPEREKKQSRLSSTSNRLKGIFGSRTKTQKQQRAKNK